MDKRQLLYQRMRNKVLTFQYIAVWLLMISTTFVPNGEWSKWLYDFLPPSLFVSQHFPVTSKVVNNYIAFSTIILSCIVCFKYYDYFVEKAKELVLTKSKWYLLKAMFLLLIATLIPLLAYFGYWINFILQPEKLRYGIFFTNYILFGLISPLFSFVFLLFIIYLFLYFIAVKNILFGVYR